MITAIVMIDWAIRVFSVGFFAASLYVDQRDHKFQYMLIAIFFALTSLRFAP